MDVYPRGESEMYALSIRVFRQHLDWQVSFVAQISNSLRQISSVAEHLTLGHKGHRHSSEEYNAVDPTEWHKLLRPFKNVKTLHIGSGLVEQLSRCLELENEDGELPLELLPVLQELTYSASGTVGDAFASFISACQNAGRPVTCRNGRNPCPRVGARGSSDAAVRFGPVLRDFVRTPNRTSGPVHLYL